MGVPKVEDVIGDVRREVEAEFRARLRERLLNAPVEWLVDELMARMEMACPPTVGSVLVATPAASAVPATATSVIDELALRAFVQRCQPLDRERLESEGYLLNPPHKGSLALVTSDCRSDRGEALLREAKQLLEALLFGDAASGVHLARAQRELLTITVARHKAPAIACLLRAATEIEAEGTWRDPERVANDARAPNTMIEVEYGEVRSELVGRAIAVALRLINDLEINEQVLYARMEDVEDSSLEPAS